MKRGRPCFYLDLAIETSHILRLVYKQPLRQTEGFIKSIVTLLRLDLIVPDHTTLSRRARKIAITQTSNISKEKLVVIVDSTGLKVFGEKEWMNTKHGTKQRKVWRKLNIAIDDEGEILSSTLTTHEVSDVSQVPDLLEEIEVPIDEFIGDAGGYDCLSQIEKDQLALLYKHSPKLKEMHRAALKLTHIFNTHQNRKTALTKLNRWIATIQKSGLTGFDGFIKTLTKYKTTILNYFKERKNSGFVEGLNNKLKVLKRRCYGVFKTDTLFQRLFLDLQGYQAFA